MRNATPPAAELLLSAKALPMLALFAALALLPRDAAAQRLVPRGTAATPPATAPGIDPTGAGAGEVSTPNTPKRVTPMFAPIPMKNTQLGWGLMLLAGVIHRFDADTTIKPSTGMVGAFYTENDSWGVMALEMARLAHDRLRLRAMAGHMEINYRFYGIGEENGEAGQSVRIDQTINMALGSALVRTVGQLYLGFSAAYMQNTVNLPDTLLAIAPPSLLDRAKTTLFAPGVQAEIDTRNDDYWPLSGNWVTFKSFFFGSALGGERKFQRYLPYWSHYQRLSGDQVLLATNVNACAASGNTPFYALCSVGAGMGGLRGYTQGRYRDTVMTTAQSELRLHTYDGRLGAVAFAGFGMVAPNIGDIFNAKVLPAGGLGLRYQLTKDYPMHLRLDYAWGRDEGLLYFGVAEAF